MAFLQTLTRTELACASQTIVLLYVNALKGACWSHQAQPLQTMPGPFIMI